MNVKSKLRNMKFYRAPRILRSLMAGIAVFTLSATLVGCGTHQFVQTYRTAESEFPLNSPNFETTVVNAYGEADCFYILFSIPLCKEQNLATIAWGQMRQEAQLEGKSAQLVNVFEDRSLKWNFFYIFYVEYYTVSANVIVYK